jgi:hypothetical protein
MLSLYARLTKLFRGLEQKVKVAAIQAGDKARIRAVTAADSLREAAEEMRDDATRIEGRAKANFSAEIKRIGSVLEGI